MTVHVLQGEREKAAANKSLGQFNLEGIPPAQRGMPQIEVNFDIDANGILNVSAKDKATGKEQSIVIKASSGLSDEEVEKMVRDAEKNAEEDKKFQQLISAKNTAESLVHGVEKSLEELGDKVEAEEKTAIQDAVKKVQTAMAGEDLEAIENATKELTEKSSKLSEKMYQEAEQAEANEAKGNDAEDAEEVIDADFQEVDEDKKRQVKFIHNTVETQCSNTLRLYNVLRIK